MLEFLQIIVIVGLIVITITQTQKNIKRNNNSYTDYIDQVLILAVYVMKSDQKIQKNEVRFIQGFLAREYEPDEVQGFLRKLNYIKDKTYNINKVLQFVREHENMSTRIQILHLLVRIAVIDQYVTNNEFKALITMTKGLGLSATQLNSMLAMYSYVTENQHQQRQQQSQSTYRSTSSKSEQAYAILEIEKTATADEIKKSYRKLVKIHHPDKVAHLGESEMKSAKVKFQKIQESYEYLKQEKGFN